MSHVKESNCQMSSADICPMNVEVLGQCRFSSAELKCRVSKCRVLSSCQVSGSLKCRIGCPLCSHNPHSQSIKCQVSSTKQNTISARFQTSLDDKVSIVNCLVSVVKECQGPHRFQTCLEDSLSVRVSRRFSHVKCAMSSVKWF